MGAVQYVDSGSAEKSANKVNNVADKVPTRDMPTKLIFSTYRTFTAYITNLQSVENFMTCAICRNVVLTMLTLF